MCGNLGDPIIAQDCLEIFQYLRNINHSMKLSLNTNGSARQPIFWQGLAAANVRILFGIDGMSDTHSIYRIDTDFNKIIENATAFIQAGGHAEWHMLVFKHNEHQVEECRDMSSRLGFVAFTTKHTSRFTENGWAVLDDDGRTRYTIYPTEKSLDMIVKKEQSVIDVQANSINCMAKRSQQIYIGADGAVSPCCWLDLKWSMPILPKRIDYMDRIGSFPNLNTSTLEHIFDSKFFDSIENTWNNKPLLTCSQQCGKFNKLRAQYVD